MLGTITKSNPGGAGTPTETKAIFSKFIFTKMGRNVVMVVKIILRVLQQDRKKVITCMTRLLNGYPYQKFLLPQAARSDSYN